MRDVETIDADLRVLIVIRQRMRDDGRASSSRLVDELLDERISASNATSTPARNV
jgi:hypothetical protein